MSCEQELRVQAYLDGELDALDATSVEAHLENCAACQAQCEAHGDLKSALAGAEYHRASPMLRARIAKSLDSEKKTHPRFLAGFWAGLSSGAGGMALAACLALYFVTRAPAGLTDALVTAHMDAMDRGKLFMVASSDHHTVKPWFAGHADVSPPVTDFKTQGFTLVGGRSDRIVGQRAAVTIYRHGLHVVALYAWADTGRAVPADATRKGYHAVYWKQADMDFAAVSDTAPGELYDFVSLVKKSSQPE
jgi:anti-sigma factor RsiW